MTDTQTLAASDTATRWYRLEATDAWFFRDGRPSNRGEDQSDIVSQFPPNPATVVGALRAALARACPHAWDGHSDWPSEIKHVLGDGDDLRSLTFTGPFLVKDGQTVFAMPRHVLGRHSEDGKSFRPLDWLVPSADPMLSDLGEVRLPTALGLCQSEPGEKALGSTDEFLVTTEGMTKILAGELPTSDDCIHRDELFVLEGRIGIARDVDSRTTGEHAMYSPRYVRLRPGVALLVGVSGLPAVGWSLPSHITLGGESRLASCELIESPSLPAQHTGGERSVLVLVTPASFSGNENWYGAGPDDDASAFEAKLAGTVVSATFDRPLGIGGWDSVNGRPLPIVPHVRPGTVWWITCNEPIKSDRSTASLRVGHKTNFGYGIGFVGKSR